MRKNSITFVIFTKNEEARIENVILNFKDYGSILIADGGSTDKTIDIAKSYNCDIYIRENEYVYLENQELVNKIFERINTEWIYWAFADEMIQKKTLEYVIEKINTDKYDIIKMVRKNYFYGKFLHDMYRANSYRFFKKDTINFKDNPIHFMGNAIVPNERILQLENYYYVHHFISSNAKAYLNTYNTYTDAELDFNYKSKKSILYFFQILCIHFIKEYIFRRGYKSGSAGLYFLSISFFYIILKDIKLFEFENDLSLSHIEELNNKIRLKIISQINKS